MKVSMLLCALAVVALISMPAHASESPEITSLTITSLTSAGCSSPNVCIAMIVDSPQPGTIELELTGHRPGTSGFVDTGAPHVVVPIVPDQMTYTACFGDVTSFVVGQGFDILRVEVASTTVPGLEGTPTKSDDFTLCTSPTPPPPSPTPAPPPPLPSPTPAPSPAPSPTSTSTPAPTPVPASPTPPPPTT
jgi:hypothetical protein